MRIPWRSFRFLIFICLIIYGATFVPVVKDIVRIGGAPFIQFTRRLGESIIDSLKLLPQIATISRENGALRSRINELSALEVSNAELKHENELLRKELSLSTTNSMLIAAQVISRTSAVSQQTLVVNKGSNDGFTQGMAVIAQGYLVGRIDEVTPNTSKVLLLTSTDSLLPVVLQNSRSLGLLRGGAGGLVIEEIPRDINITIGEAAVTSNTGDIIKSGIPVGNVVSVVSEKSDVFQSARINSPVDFSRLEVIFGVK